MIIIAIGLILILVITYLVINNNNIINVTVEKPQNIQVKSYDKQIIKDPVREYDYRKIDDPLEEPTRRVPRHWIPPVHIKRHIDFPTRGFPDNFSQLGILVSLSKKDKDNRILRLYGRQEYPGSERYEYYTAINSGLDQIKIPLDIKKRELYDGDYVYIDELKAKYEVKLHKYDAPKYYPDIL